jgi:predicted dehydrogenase
MGRRHIRVLSELPQRFDLVGGYDIRRESQAHDVSPASLASLARFESEAEAIAACDVLVVATPILAHTATVARALSAGKRVLVEKPLCARFSEADVLVAAGRVASRGRERLFVGHTERFNPVVRNLARLARGERLLALDFHRVGLSRPNEVGVLLNLGVHDLDLAAYLGGGLVTLRGAVGGDDFADVLLSTPTAATVHVHVDRTAPHKRRTITLSTPVWTYEGDLLAQRLVRTARDTGLRSEVPLDTEEPLVAQARALADALDGGPVRELATGADGAAAVRLAELALDACMTEAVEPLSEKRGSRV